jgi:hypothetical protein
MPKTRSLTKPRSVIAAMKKVLKQAGLPIYRSQGRYPDHVITPGIRVAKLGVSKWVAVSHSGTKAPERETEARAFDLLRQEGFPLDGRGWIECEFYDDGD